MALLAFGTRTARIVALAAVPATAAVATLIAFAAVGGLVLLAEKALQPAEETAGFPGGFFLTFGDTVRGVFAGLETGLLAPRFARLEAALVTPGLARAALAAFPPIARLERAAVLAARSGAGGFPANL